MDKYITYNEQELTEIVNSISINVRNLEAYAIMMKEQHDGKRKNLDMGISSTLLYDIDQMKEKLKTFGL